MNLYEYTKIKEAINHINKNEIKEALEILEELVKWER